MICLGATILMQCASERADEVGVEQRHNAADRVIPSQIAMYSGRFGISRPTTSPGATPCCSAQRA